ncbi:MAG: winged helix DNA-binding domain-containing protein [Micromonosporaceae bacterium]|nr:winged helix DNA-binding domain-containing protein [Micromonosporaceae bacterium]
MERVGVEQRRARLARRHHLAPGGKAASPVEAARGMVALHSTDPASVFLATHARTDPPAPVAAIEQALYEDRSLLRMHGMRRTMFVVETALAPVVQAACTDAVAELSWRRYAKLLSEHGAGDRDWLAAVAGQTAEAIAARGQATGAQLSADVPGLRTQLLLNEGKKYESRQNITSWVLFLLAAEGRIVRGRPRGSWASSQYTWAPAQKWLPAGMPAVPTGPARVELVRRWLAAFGPGTVADLRWWTGLTAGQVKQALAELDPVEVDLDGTTGLLLPDDLAPVPPPDPWVALLPALDPTPMGWTGRAWFLGEHAPAVFDRNGNIGPSVWCDGRIVGGWAQRAGGEIAYRLLEDVGRQAAAAVEAAAAALGSWVDRVRITPRFRTPLERELAGAAAPGAGPPGAAAAR